MVFMRYFSAIPMQKTNYYKKSLAQFPLDEVYVGRLYDSSMQRKLRRFKFAHNTVDTAYFASIFRQLIAENALQSDESISIVYPSISLKDRVFRGSNHAKSLAKLFGKELGVTVILCPFKKAFFAGHQSLRNKQQRKQVRSEYTFHQDSQDKIRGRDILLIDDIITTGQTAYTLGTLLKKAGARTIRGFFLSSHKV